MFANEKLEEFRQRVVGTNIDSKSLLSTDYFNAFNSIIMVLDMLPDAPELLGEIEQWRFVDYPEHFRASGLDFADLAIEAYTLVPPDVLKAFERKVSGIRIVIEGIAPMLRRLVDAGEMEAFSHLARAAVLELRAMTQAGNGIVHGGGSVGQADIDKMF
jgi:hypothetical protein